MNSLDQFLKPIEVAGKPLKHKAYKMDEPNNKSTSMRCFVGLGECNCCDYFFSQEGAIVLIEETQLSSSMQHFRNEYPYLNDKDKDDFSIKKVREEIRLKAYGAMLVLCRLTTKSPQAKKLIEGKKYNFWLVASGMTTDDIVVFDNIKDTLLSMLKGALSKEIIDNVEVLPSETLEKRLSGK